MINIKEAIIVEGTYDKIKLNQIVDTLIITTNGFNIFKNKDKMNMIKSIAQKCGIVILTDSDRAGFIIRNYIKQCVPAKYIKHAYVPEIKGVEKRKRIPGKEGLLGVEGIDNEIIKKSLQNAGCIIENNKDLKENTQNITKSHFYEDGLIGKSGSAEKRKKLIKKLNLPLKISTNSLLQVLNTLYDYEWYKETISKL